MTPPTDFAALLRQLLTSGVECILVGGVAANVHGSARATYDIDLVYRRSAENLDRIVAALTPLAPYLRGAPPGLPFVLDEATLRRGLNFTLTTRLGDIDLLGEVAGAGAYDELLPASETITLFDLPCRTATLDALKKGQDLSWRDAIEKGVVVGTLTKTWVTVHDDRVRPEHVAMDGQTVPFDAPYSNGQMVPGETDYNCRCISRVTVKREPIAKAA